MALQPAPRDPVTALSPLTSKSLAAGTAVVVPRDILHDRKVAQKLAEIAFIGAFLGHTQAAEKIFHSLRVLRPDNPAVELGLAMIYTLAGRPQDGLALVERAPGLDADQGVAAVCTGLMLRDAGHRAAAEKKLARAIAQGDVAGEFVQALSSAMRE